MLTASLRSSGRPRSESAYRKVPGKVQERSGPRAGREASPPTGRFQERSRKGPVLGPAAKRVRQHEARLGEAVVAEAAEELRARAAVAGVAAKPQQRGAARVLPAPLKGGAVRRGGGHAVARGLVRVGACGAGVGRAGATWTCREDVCGGGRGQPWWRRRASARREEELRHRDVDAAHEVDGRLRVSVELEPEPAAAGRVGPQVVWQLAPSRAQCCGVLVASPPKQAAQGTGADRLAPPRNRLREQRHQPAHAAPTAASGATRGAVWWHL